MDRTIYVNMSKARLLQILRGIPKAAQQNIKLQKRIVNAVLARVQKAFLIKSRGGTDEIGDRWQPLAQSTIARRSRRRGPRPSGELTAGQRDKWWNYYRAALWKFKDKGVAAKIAWATLKRKLEYIPLFNKQGAHVEILRDTLALFASLSPNTISPNKVLRLGRGEMVFGTNRKGARAHHRGVRGKLPQRRLWPDPKKWASSWWQPILHDTREGVIDLVLARVIYA
jgi:hypothetical protein